MPWAQSKGNIGCGIAGAEQVDIGELNGKVNREKHCIRAIDHCNHPFFTHFWGLHRGKFSLGSDQSFIFQSDLEMQPN
jgi:hypothetical protein